MSDDHEMITMPIAQFVERFLEEVCHSAKSVSIYRRAVALFIQHLEAERAHRLPPKLRERWHPFAEQVQLERRRPWLYNVPAAVLKLADDAVIDSYADWRQDCGDSASVRRARLSAVRSFLTMARASGLTDDRRLSKGMLSSYKYQTIAHRYLDNGDVKRLRAAVDTSTAVGKRDLLLLDLILYGGLRRSELTDVQLADIEMCGDEYIITVGGRKLNAHPTLAQSLQDYLRALDKTCGADGTLLRHASQGGVLISRPMPVHSANKIVHRYAPGYSPEVLRRTCGRNAYENGAKLTELHHFLGFKSLQSCINYLGLKDDDGSVATGVVRFIQYD